jgi:hypothetical protein
MEVLDSDHKPVRCVLDVDLATMDESARRREYGKILKVNPKVRALLAQCNVIPLITLNTNLITLQDCTPSFMHITNVSRSSTATFIVHCDGEPLTGKCPCGHHNNDQHTSKPRSVRGNYGFPQWLKVHLPIGFMCPRLPSIFWHSLVIWGSQMLATHSINQTTCNEYQLILRSEELCVQVQSTHWENAWNCGP